MFSWSWWAVYCGFAVLRFKFPLGGTTCAIYCGLKALELKTPTEQVVIGALFTCEFSESEGTKLPSWWRQSPWPSNERLSRAFCSKLTFLLFCILFKLFKENWNYSLQLFLQQAARKRDASANLEKVRTVREVLTEKLEEMFPGTFSFRLSLRFRCAMNGLAFTLLHHLPSTHEHIIQRITVWWLVEHICSALILLPRVGANSRRGAPNYYYRPQT